MTATTHFHHRLHERYGIQATADDLALWMQDIAHGRAELVWVFLGAQSRVYRLRHRPSGTEIFGVYDPATRTLITAHEPWSFERMADGWYQRSEGERLAMAGRA